MKVELSRIQIGYLQRAIDYLANSLDGTLIDNSKVDYETQIETLKFCFYQHKQFEELLTEETNKENAKNEGETDNE
ncbi:hypothetical protein [Caproiciproducens sp.]